MELCLVHERDKSCVGTRGSFSPEGGRLMQALDQFPLNCTTGVVGDVCKGNGNSSKRGSHESPEGTAFGGFSLAKKKLRHEAIGELESAIFEFAVGGKAACVDANLRGLSRSAQLL